MFYLFPPTNADGIAAACDPGITTTQELQLSKHLNKLLQCVHIRVHTDIACMYSVYIQYIPTAVIGGQPVCTAFGLILQIS